MWSTVGPRLGTKADGTNMVRELDALRRVPDIGLLGRDLGALMSECLVKWSISYLVTHISYAGSSLQVVEKCGASCADRKICVKGRDIQ